MSNVIQRRFSDNYIRPRNLFDEIFSDFFDRSQRAEAFSPHVDFWETTDSYSLSLEIPGVDKEAVTIDLKDNILTISGEKAQEIPDKDVLSSMYERKVGKFSRAFHLPQSADQSKITATSREGVLRIVIPKHEDKKPQKIPVT